MNKSRISLLLVGLLAVAGAQAQTAAATSSVPVKSGEASTQVQGQPNMDPNSPSASRMQAYPNAQSAPSYPSAQVMPRTREEVRQETRGMGAAAATTPVPDRAGEASTMVRGQPNVDPNAPMRGSPVYHHRVGVPITLPEGSPSVFQGGTPQ